MMTCEEIRSAIAAWREYIDEALWYKKHNLLPLNRIGELDCQETADWLREAHAHVDAAIADASARIAELQVELTGYTPITDDPDGLYAEVCTAIDEMCAEFDPSWL